MGSSVSRKLKRKGGNEHSENIYLKSEFRLSDEQIKEYRALFKQHSENSKIITKNGFRNVYQQMYRNGDAIDFADRVFHTFDTDKNGTVDFIEFAAGLTMMDSKMIEQKMSIAFHMYDEDGSNTLSKQEVINMIQVDKLAILYISV
jgi:Ca2+-binding EF-hand superfamily protein